MKTTLYLSYLFPLLLVSLETKSQIIQDIFDPDMLNQSMFKPDRYKEISGSPYFGESLYTGALTITGGKIFNEVTMRYNGYEDALLVVLDGDVMALLDPDKLESFQYNDGSGDILFRSFRMKKEGNEPHFFQVLYENKTKYLKRHLVILGQSKNNAGSYGDSAMQGQSFKSITKRLIVLPSGTSSEVKPSRKSFLQVLKDQNGKIEQFIKKKKLKLGKDEDIVTLLKYYESLN